ncbi:hypothetical protein E2C01_001901 [Portunus trituberculatus]|uniref:Uncharacterized protein n=1 Tax=Portunus trituberculatus TaxID=210409 RepID=A0A5B7CKP5_PORTR|nr:hypothetical protein [Portunus trituberculatus]
MSAHQEERCQVVQHQILLTTIARVTHQHLRDCHCVDKASIAPGHSSLSHHKFPEVRYGEETSQNIEHRLLNYESVCKTNNHVQYLNDALEAS